MQDKLERWLGTLFGLVFVALSGVVAVETVVRKVFNFSLQGADELGGYALAVGATLAFSMALLGRTHIRVDVFHGRLPRWLQTGLNWFAAVGLAVFALLLAWLARYVLTDSLEYNSVAQTPWATPLWWPQTAWLAGLVVFALIATVFAARATVLLLRGQTTLLNREFGPRSTKDEVDEELEDLQARATGTTA
ncbi:MAG: TRAP transporter small permease [Rubrivivax sp.]|nr:TRAP transporter small permease [Rubrivivax sp.]